MKCGVRFCGGCNSKFDRGALYDTIKQRLQGEVEFEYAQENITYDLLLVIGGCTNCCASYDVFHTRKGVVKIWQVEDLEKTIQIIKDFK